MILGYLKYRIKDFLCQSIIIYKLRYGGHIIGRKCSIYSTLFNGKCVLKDNVILGPDVELSGGNTIGSGARISRILVGKNTQFDQGVVCTGLGNGKISIGRECYIGINNILDWSDNIIIGDYVQIAGPTTALWTHSGALMCMNSVNLSNTSKEFRPTSPIKIESNVYIGGNCTIYPGVTVGHHSIIAPNSAVTKNVQSYTMVGGVPAREIKSLKESLNVE